MPDSISQTAVLLLPFSHSQTMSWQYVWMIRSWSRCEGVINSRVQENPRIPTRLWYSQTHILNIHVGSTYRNRLCQTLAQRHWYARRVSEVVCKRWPLKYALGYDLAERDCERCERKCMLDEDVTGRSDTLSLLWMLLSMHERDVEMNRHNHLFRMCVWVNMIWIKLFV